jgi:PAS domain S-box-containing protein
VSTAPAQARETRPQGFTPLAAAPPKVRNAAQAPEIHSFTREVLVPAVAVTLIAILRLLLARSLGWAPPFIFFVPAVIFAGWFGGIRAGLVATALGVTIGWCILVPPAFTLFKGNAELVARLIIFIFGGYSLSVLSSHWRVSKIEISRQEQRFRSTFENAAVGMAHVAPDGRWLRVNQRLYEILGESAGPLFSGKWTDLNGGSESIDEARKIRNLLSGDITSYSIEKQCRRVDGSAVWVSLTVSLERDESGKPDYFIAVFEDVSARKQAEESLQVNLLQLQATFDGMAEPALLADADGKVLATNSAYLSLFEFTHPPRTRYEVFETFELSSADGQLFDPATSPFIRALNGEVIRELEFKGRNRQTGRILHFTSGAAPVRDARGNVAAVILTCHDITERKRAEEALERTNEALERSNMVLRQFAYAAAHDLREPLRNVAISSELLARRHPAARVPEIRRLLDTNVEGARRMHQMVMDLLEYANTVDFPAGETSLTDTSAAFERAVANLKQTIEENHAVISNDTLPDLRVADVHLVQLFQNLIGNSLKYRKPDEVPAVHVSAQRTSKEWVISVHDNGIGFEPEYKDRIFGLFKRLHTRGEYPGTGIGLAICARIVEQYGGRIWAESSPDEGSTFHFSLPHLS